MVQAENGRHGGHPIRGQDRISTNYNRCDPGANAPTQESVSNRNQDLYPSDSFHAQDDRKVGTSYCVTKSRQSTDDHLPSTNSNSSTRVRYISDTQHPICTENNHRQERSAIASTTARVFATMEPETNSVETDYRPTQSESSQALAPTATV